MGGLLSSNQNEEEEPETRSGGQGVYRYPPKPGTTFFANHFIMGGEKFEAPEPESFLFGENSDLNFLGSKPVPFPYPPPQPNEPTKTLRSLVHIRRDSLHFVPVADSYAEDIEPPPAPLERSDVRDEDDEDDDEEDVDETTNVARREKNGARRMEMAKVRNAKRYNIEFTFDCDVDCSITIYYFCTEEVTGQAAVYTPLKPHMKSDTYHYTRGAGKLFSQPSHVFHPGSYVGHTHQPMSFINPDTGIIPVAIQCLALEGDTPRQSHTTVAVIETTSDRSGYILKPLKQKLYVDGLSYLLQEIYGLENKCSDSQDEAANQFDDEFDDSGSDCVVCMCELRDTIILPCRHLCLCYTCADSLRFQANNCPICRAPFRALLQIRAVQRVNHAAHPALAGSEPAPQEGIPAGYTAVNLVDALNGPSSANQQHPPPVVSLTTAKKKKRKSSKEKHHPTNVAGAREEEQPLSPGRSRLSLEMVNEATGPDGDAQESSVDLVEEELANMAVAESLTDLASVSGDLPAKKRSAKPSSGRSSPSPGGIDVCEEAEETERAGAVIVNIARTKYEKRSFPGTPTSTSSSIRSSQDSSSSTKHLLAKPDGARGTSNTKQPSVKIVPSAAAKVVNVSPSEADDEMC